MAIAFEPVGEDEDERRNLDQLLTRLIDDSTQEPIFSRWWEAEHGVESLVIAVRSDDELIGGVWMSDAVDGLRDPALRRSPLSWRQNVARRYAMGHKIAVAPEFRGRGIGQQLTLMAIEWAKERGKDAVYGVSGPESAGFHRQMNCQVGRPNEAIYLSAPPDPPMVFPIEGASRWVAFDCRTTQTGAIFRFGPPPP